MKGQMCWIAIVIENNDLLTNIIEKHNQIKKGFIIKNVSGPFNLTNPSSI